MLGQVSRTVARVSSIQKRSLASTVLFTRTPEQWHEQTVSHLRSEAKRRGLTTGGSKTKLVERILAHIKSTESSGLATQAVASSPFTPARHRWISSSSVAQADLEQGKFKPRFSRNLDVKIPETPEEPDEGPVIPFLAQKFDSPPSESASPPQEAPDNSPKVVTVASAATHIGGGPQHAIHESVDSYSIETPEMESQGGGSSFNLKGLLNELGIPISFNFGQQGEAIREAVANVGIAAPKIGKDTTDLKEARRELNEEEQRGLYVLGGIVLGGLVLGSIGNKKLTIKRGEH